ncbi:MAG TPA: ABC transporter permease [Candidatus Sulfopaludibacter sp.]|jgi:putative ABC transport system permease protein|nr:ABC transporter permease [Candidatus Sulfopaludibacter sp.]
MDTLRQDLTYAVRVLMRKPGFTTIAVFTLALGIAANTAIFSLVNGVLLQPLPYPHAERLVNLWTIYPESHGQQDIYSPANFLDVQARTQSLEAVGAYTEASFTLSGAGQPEFFPGIKMSASTSRVLGIAPQLGRWFTQQEDDGGQAVAVLSDSLWRNRFGADPNILGRKLDLSGQPYTVVGVLPPQAGYPSMLTQIYAPISFDAEDRASRGSIFLNAIARMRPGVSLAKARAELRTLAAGIPMAGLHMGADSLQQSLVGNVRDMLIVLWAAVAFMLAVGCANVANLMLAHAAGRQREFAVRRSLGASDGRLVRQLLTESLVLALAGGICGLAVAALAVPAMAAQLPAGFPRIREIGMDGEVLWFTFGMSLLTGVLFGLAPAAGSARRDLAQAIREGGNRGGSGVAHKRAGRLLVVAEIAAVLVLMVGAGLVLRSLIRLSSVNPGFQPHGVVAWQMNLPSSRYPDPPAQRAFYRRVLEQVRSLPGVESASLVQPLPFGPVDLVNDGGFAIAGRPIPVPGQRPQSLIARAAPEYFATMKIPLLRGRIFGAQETAGAPPEVMISETLARRYFEGQDAVGQHLLLGRNQLSVEIAGVVGDVKHNNLRNDIRPELYLPLMRLTPGAAGLVVRTAGDPGALLPSLQRRVWSVDNSIAANLSGPVDRFLYASLAPARVATVLLAGFAAITLILGLIGVYGVLSYVVRQRTREIGIRLALGAAPSGVLRMVLGEALGMSVAGVVVGTGLALVLTRYLDSLLFRVSGWDPLTYAAAALTVPCAALLAAYQPARRATRIDPALSLRAEG